MIKTNEYHVKEYPEPKNYFQELVDMYSDRNTKVSAQAIETQVGKPAYDMLLKLKSVQDMFNVPQARMPFLMEVK